MTEGFCNFINTATGEVVSLPAHYAALFPDSLELTDQDVECVDCDVTEQPVVEEALPTEEPFAAPVSVSITEPARRSRGRR